MSMRKRTDRIKTTGLVLCLAAWSSMTGLQAWAQCSDPVLLAPQHVVATAPIMDEFGQRLPGIDPAAPAFGFTTVQGDLVQIMATPNTILPPNPDGTPNPGNTVIHTTRIGVGVPVDQQVPGTFGAASVKPDPCSTYPPSPTMWKVFARVFNAPTLAEASFYGDSEIFNVSYFAQNTVFVPTITATDQPLDSGDDDGDGLHNSWEKSYGTGDQSTPDYDNDGFIDLHEHIAGTGLDDDSSYLAVGNVEYPGDGDATVSWASVPGKIYDVQFTSDPLDQNPVWTTAAIDVPAAGDVTEVSIPGGMAASIGTFRVRVKP